MKKSLASCLKHQVIFLENLATSSIESENWQEKTKAFSEIKPICDTAFKSLESLDFGHVMTEGLFMFKIRFMKGINIKMRILFNDRQFEIKRIIDIAEQNRVLKIIGLEI
jgi:SPP1 family predicted phage head-tail adaptor